MQSVTLDGLFILVVLCMMPLVIRREGVIDNVI